MINYSSVQEIKSLLAENSLSMSRQRGQNFLVSKAVRDRIAGEVLEQAPGTIWEIGPGIGNLTSSLLERRNESQNIVLFEYDFGFCRLLEDTFSEEPNLRLVKGDFLETYPAETQTKPDCICGNLPYNVGSVIIMELLKSALNPERMVFMLQKEVASRITAGPGTAAYSAFSMHCQLEWDVRFRFSVAPGSFYPAPNVTSAVVVFTRKPGGPFPYRKSYFTLVDDLFSSRRKTIANNLKKSRLEFSAAQLGEAFNKCGINCGLRAERLEPLQLKNVIKMLYS
ncbi:MAG: ribosomal RNA small subunit methyltransferase A [Spirochaetales bacterium]|nr:ribosomal RNA small subunit methyltransferase A [Spirochaetales bacterium]